MRPAATLHRLRVVALHELMRRRRLAKWIRRLRRTARREPGSFQVYLQLGLAYVRLGAFEEAAASLQRAAFLNPQHHPIWIDLGLVQARLGQLAEARQSLETALALHPGDAAVEAHLARLGSSLFGAPGTPWAVRLPLATT